jgi:hypothetical protein
MTWISRTTRRLAGDVTADLARLFRAGRATDQRRQELLAAAIADRGKTWTGRIVSIDRYGQPVTTWVVGPIAVQDGPHGPVPTLSGIPLSKGSWELFPGDHQAPPMLPPHGGQVLAEVLTGQTVTVECSSSTGSIGSIGSGARHIVEGRAGRIHHIGHPARLGRHIGGVWVWLDEVSGVMTGAWTTTDPLPPVAPAASSSLRTDRRGSAAGRSGGGLVSDAGLTSGTDAA